MFFSDSNDGSQATNGGDHPPPKTWLRDGDVRELLVRVRVPPRRDRSHPKGCCCGIFKSSESRYNAGGRSTTNLAIAEEPSSSHSGNDTKYARASFGRVGPPEVVEV